MYKFLVKDLVWIKNNYDESEVPVEEKDKLDYYEFYKNEEIYYLNFNSISGWMLVNYIDKNSKGHPLHVHMIEEGDYLIEVKEEKK